MELVPTLIQNTVSVYEYAGMHYDYILSTRMGGLEKELAGEKEVKVRQEQKLKWLNEKLEEK